MNYAEQKGVVNLHLAHANRHLQAAIDLAQRDDWAEVLLHITEATADLQYISRHIPGE